MKKTLWIVALLAITCSTLAGCNKDNTPVENPVENPEEVVEIANPASVYCEENGGTLMLEEGAWLCMFDDGSYCEEWAYQRWECQPGDIFYNAVEDSVLPEWAKTSLTNEELDEIAETNFPTSYSYSTYNTETEESNLWEYTYPEDISHTLLLPIHTTMASREVVSSGIEDGMIYTLTNVTLQDDTVVSVLYIVDPVTLNFVAANVENGNETTNYQFIY